MQTYNPTLVAGIKASEHVAYECRVLRQSFTMLEELVRDELRMKVNPGLRQALTESFIVHARNLRYFFYTSAAKRGHPLDVLAVDFIPNWLSTAPRCSISLDLYNRMHREVAHISAARFDFVEGQPQWSFGATPDALNPTIDAFFTKVPSSDLSDQVKTNMRSRTVANVARTELSAFPLHSANVATVQSFTTTYSAKTNLDWGSEP